MGLKKGNIGKTEIDAAGNTIYIDFKKAHSKAFKKEGKVNGNERIETVSKYSHVSFESRLNYAGLYPSGIYDKDRKGWLD